MNSGIGMILGVIGAVVGVSQQISPADLLAGIPLGMWTLLSLVSLYALGAWLWEKLSGWYSRLGFRLRKSASASRK